MLYLLKRISSLPLVHLGALVGATLALATLVIMGSLMAWIMVILGDANNDRYGNNLAGQLAGLAASAVVTGDLLQLNLMTAQAADDPAIFNVAVFDTEHRLLSTSGRQDPNEALATQEPTYERPVLFEEKPIGYVRLVLDQRALRPALTPTIGLAVASVLVLTLGIYAGRRCGKWLDARLFALEHRLAQDISAEITGNQSLARIERIAALLRPDREELPASADLLPKKTPYLLVINIFNQVSLPASDRERALDELTIRIARICTQHNGRALRLPGTGVFALLEPRDDNDAFPSICAALLSLRCVHELNTLRQQAGLRGLTLRAGLDRLVRAPSTQAGEDALRDDLESELAEVVLLSATARNDTIAVTRAVFEGLSDASAVQWTAIRAAIPPSGDEGMFHYQISDVAPQHAPLLDRQLNSLSTTGQTATVG